MFYNRRRLVGVVMLGAGLNRDWYLNEARREGYRVLIGDGRLLLFK